MVEASLVGADRELVRGAAPGAEATCCIQYCKKMVLGLFAFFGHMLPRLEGGGHGHGDFHYRVPPAWSPEHLTDLLRLTVATCTRCC